jgi:hypothetical protein
MTGTAEGARRAAATRLGVSYEEYSTRLDAGERPCFLCRRWRSESHFNRNARNHHGRQSHCRDCIRDYMRVYMRRAVHHAGPSGEAT